MYAILKEFYKYLDILGLGAGFSNFLKIKTKKTGKIKLPGIQHTFQLRSGSSDIAVFRQIFLFKSYDIPLPFIPENIVDAGANIGLATIYFHSKYPKSKIISIEPEPDNFKLLEENTKSYSNITPINKALSNQAIPLQIIDPGNGNWGFMTAYPEQGDLEDITSKIEAITIAQIMESYGLDYLDVLKIDIEGFEKELFESDYESWLPRTKCLIIELHDRIKPGCSKSLFQAISKYDFSFSQKAENLIFINNELV